MWCSHGFLVGIICLQLVLDTAFLNFIDTTPFRKFIEEFGV